MPFKLSVQKTSAASFFHFFVLAGPLAKNVKNTGSGLRPQSEENERQTNVLNTYQKRIENDQETTGLGPDPRRQKQW